MRNIKAVPLLIVAAVVAVAFAAPASASANTWMQGGIKISKPANIELSGKASWNFVGQGYECSVSGKATLVPGGTGEITEYKIQPATCVGFGAGWKWCEVTSATASTPWAIQAVEEGGKKFITVSKFSYVLWLKSKSGGTCPRSSWEVVGTSITATPDNSNAFSSLLFGGTVLAGGNPTGIGNTLSVSPAGVYGIS